VARHPRILQRVKQAVDFALKTAARLVVGDRQPDFTHRVAQGIKKPTLNRNRGLCRAQVWASRAYRAKKMASYFDLVLARFPSECRSSRYGLRRPLSVSGDRAGRENRRRCSVARPSWHCGDARCWRCCRVGRTSEIRFILPEFRAAVEILRRKFPTW